MTIRAELQSVFLRLQKALDGSLISFYGVPVGYNFWNSYKYLCRFCCGFFSPSSAIVLQSSLRSNENKPTTPFHCLITKLFQVPSFRSIQMICKATLKQGKASHSSVIVTCTNVNQLQFENKPLEEQRSWARQQKG